MTQFLKWGWRFAIAALLSFSITLNVAAFIGTVFWTSASTMFEAATGWRSHMLLQADTIQDLQNEHRHLRTANADLDRQNRALQSNLDEALETVTHERKIAASMADELARLKNERVLLRGTLMTRSQAVANTTQRISKRAVRTTTRSVSSMAGEAMPYIGAAVIVGVTALEVRDLCRMLTDMHDLNVAFNPDQQHSDDVMTVCATQVPSASEVMHSVTNAPEATWKATKAFVTDLPDLREIELPDVDYSGVWSSAVDGTVNLGGSIKSGAATAKDATLEAISNGWQSATGTVSGLLSD